MNKHITSFLTAGLVSLSASVAAQPAEWTPTAQQSRVGIEYDWFHQGNHEAMTWDLSAQIAVTKHIVLDANLPIGFNVGRADRIGSDADNRAWFGVPTLGAHFAGSVTRWLSFHAGLAVGIPTLIDVDDVGRGSLAHLSYIRGYADQYRFTPNRMPILPRGGLELYLPPFFAGADLAPAFLIPFGSRERAGASGTTGDPYAPIITLTPTLTTGLRASFGLEGGVRFQTVFTLTSTPAPTGAGQTITVGGRTVQYRGTITLDDHVQTAIEPFLG
jgi:hypothetical protein